MSPRGVWAVVCVYVWWCGWVGGSLGRIVSPCTRFPFPSPLVFASPPSPVLFSFESQRGLIWLYSSVRTQKPALLSTLDPPASSHALPSPLLGLQISAGGAYAFVEFSEIGDATCALVLDGIPFQGCPLKIKRPKEYVPPYGVSACTFLPSLSLHLIMLSVEGVRGVRWSNGERVCSSVGRLLG